MSRRIFSRRRSRRAAALVFVVVMFPIVLLLLMMMLFDLQVRKFEVQRNEIRVQSRLLAEAGLAVASTLPRPPEKPIRGALEGAGTYLVDRTHSADGKTVFWVSGVAGPPRYQIITNTYAALGQDGKLSVLSSSAHAKSEKESSQPLFYTGPSSKGPPPDEYPETDEGEINYDMEGMN